MLLIFEHEICRRPTRNAVITRMDTNPLNVEDNLNRKIALFQEIKGETPLSVSPRGEGGEMRNKENHENPFLRKILFRVLHALSCHSTCMQAYCQPYT